MGRFRLEGFWLKGFWRNKVAIGQISLDLKDREVCLGGWVYTKRVHGGLIFITLRDGSGRIQVAIHKHEVNPKVFEEAERVTRESSVVVKGVVKEDRRAPGGLEIRCTDLNIIGLSEEFPIRKGVGLNFLLDHRHLYLRSPKANAILRIRSEVCKAARNWLEGHGFIEVHAPILITAACEGGATLFPAEYFGSKVYLTQSAQLYEEAGITTLDKVYCIGPSFRAEKSRTRRHLTEFWQIECEVSFATHEDIMEIEEELVSHICRWIVDRCGKELKLLGRSGFKPPTPPFDRITYDEALESLRKIGVEVPWGQDLTTEAERTLSTRREKPFFITCYPLSTRSFYHMPNPENPSLSLSSDLMAPEGFGELATGGQRIHDYNLLLERIKEHQLPIESYAWYLDLRKYGTVPHAGFGIGIERLVRWICGLPHIREASMFPRTLTRVYP